MKAALVKCLRFLLDQDSESVLITGDLGFGALDALQEEFPEQFLNLGVCEQSIMSIAAGMASTGRRCFVYSIANFPSFRCLEQIRNDIALHDLPVTIISNGAGFAYGTSGYSHHGVEDLSVVRSIPNIRIATPCDEVELAAVFDEVTALDGPSYIRLGSLPPNSIDDSQCTKFENLVRRTHMGSRVSIVGTGFGAHLALQVAQLLNTRNALEVSSWSVPFCWPLDSSLLRHWSAEELIVTIEEQTLAGGFGSAVWESARVLGLNPNILPIALTQEYRMATGSSGYHRSVNGLEPSQIADRILAYLHL